MAMQKIRFIDLFSGIGGMRLAFESAAHSLNLETECVLDLLQKKYVLSLNICSSLGQTLNYWVDWHLLKLAQLARL